MTPAARLAAAIELLEAIDRGHGAADRVADGFFRARRYVGAKDRAAIAERAYGILRRRIELAWRLQETDPSPRHLALAALVRQDKLDDAALDELFGGGRFGPAPLAAEERALATKLRAHRETEPDFVRGGFPAWLEPELRRRFGAELVPEMAAQQGRAPVDLRVNTLKTTREEVLRAFAADGIEAAPSRWAPHGIRLAGRARIAGHRALAEGWVEVQDEGSQLVAAIADARPGQWVLDLCAGAGGKTLALAAAMQGRGQVHALDVDRHRLAGLSPRLRRAGADNVQPRGIDGLEDPWLKKHRGRFDRVLLDVPCSGTGTWRRDPELRQRVHPERLERYRASQARLLARGADLVKPGGRLIYATCSLLPAEDEDQVEQFLAAHAGFARLAVTGIWSAVIPESCPIAGPDLLLTPRQHATDGFYAAVLERRE